MRPTQNTMIHVLLGAAVVLAIVLNCLVLAPRGRPMLSLSGWLMFGGVALTLVLATFLPSLVRRWRGLPPPQPLSPSDLGFFSMVAVAGCALAVVGVVSGMWWLMALGIMLAPLSFMFRGAAQRRRDQRSSLTKAMPPDFE